MKLRIRDIKKTGFTLTEELAAEELGLDEYSARYVFPLVVTVAAQLEENSLRVDFHIEHNSRADCARCLTETTSQQRKTFQADYDLESRTEFVELNDDIRQEMILAASSRELCRGDCRGLCPSCGVNLNKESCSCQKKGKYDKQIMARRS